jgi:uncharacterized protein
MDSSASAARADSAAAARSTVRRRRRPSRFLYTVGGLLGLLHLYIGLRLLPDLPLTTSGRTVGALALCASFALMLAGVMVRSLRSSSTAERVALLGSLATGLFSSLFVLTLLRDVALGLGALLLPAGIFASAATFSAAAVPVLALLGSVIGFISARRHPRVIDVDIPLPDLPPALHGFTIAQISDVHVGATIKRDYLDAVVRIVNSLEPDLIALTGDLVDGSVEQLRPHVAPLARLVARHGTYFVTGNHEYYSGATPWIRELRRLGLRVLLNEHVLLNHGGADLIVAGVTDYSAHHFDPDQRSDPRKALAGAPPNVRPRLLLAHQPRTALAAAAAGFDLQLSGHTHGGQFWPWNLFVRLQQPFTAGLHRLKDLWVYTSRGTGYWGPPKRLGVPSEITRLRLVRQN